MCNALFVDVNPIPVKEAMNMMGLDVGACRLPLYEMTEEAKAEDDLVEVIYACAAARGYSISELETLRAEKAAKRGGFEKKILLKTVTEEA